jgi:hypothetical protein
MESESRKIQVGIPITADHPTHRVQPAIFLLDSKIDIRWRLGSKVIANSQETVLNEGAIERIGRI